MAEQQEKKQLNGTETTKSMETQKTSKKPREQKEQKPPKTGKNWYTNYGNARLINLNYGRRAGTAIPNTNNVINVSGQSAKRWAAYPTVIGIALGLTKPLGDNDGFDDAIFNLFSTIRSANAGKTNYDQNGLFMYVHNVCVAHSLYATLRRAYAVAKSFDAYDASVPEAYFAAMGLNHTSFIDNLATIRDYANIMGLKLAKYAPLRIPLIDRRRWLFSNIFKDDNTFKSTNYIMTLHKATYFTFIQDFPDNGNIQPVGKITIGSGTNKTDWNSFKNHCDSVMRSITKSPAAADMAGDILKAFGQQAIYPAEIWPVDMKMPIIYDTQALEEIQNSESPFRTVVTETGGRAPTSNDEFTMLFNDTTKHFETAIGPDYTANVPDLSYLTNQIEPTYQQVLFNTDKATPDSSEALMTSRLKAHVDATVTSGPSGNVLSENVDRCGTEIVMFYKAVCNRTNDTGNLDGFVLLEIPFTSRLYVDTEMEPVKYYNMLEALFSIIMARSAADWAPALYLYALDRSDGVAAKSLNYLAYDFKNLAVTDQENLATLLGYGNMSLLYVPNLVRQSKLETVKIE